MQVDDLHPNETIIAILQTKGPEYRVACLEVPERFIDADLSDKQTEAMFVYTFGLCRVTNSIKEAKKIVKEVMDQHHAIYHHDGVIGDYRICVLKYAKTDFKNFMSMEQAESLDYD